MFMHSALLLRACSISFTATIMTFSGPASATGFPPAGCEDPLDLYIHDLDRRLAKVNVLTGEVTDLTQTPGVDLTDIAFSPSGRLYGISITDIYLINPGTGETTFVGSHGISTGNALVFGADGTLYAAGNSSDALWIVDPDTGEATECCTIGHSSAGDLAFNGGNLYMSSTGGELVLIAPASGVDCDSPCGRVIGPMGVNNVWGLATGDNGCLYAVSETNVYTVDTTTGQSTFLSTYDGQGLGQAGGTSFVNEAAPCPCDVNFDGQITATELFSVIDSWGSNKAKVSDCNGDGTVDVQDLIEIILRWGDCQFRN